MLSFWQHGQLNYFMGKFQWTISLIFHAQITHSILGFYIPDSDDKRSRAGINKNIMRCLGYIICLETFWKFRPCEVSWLVGHHPKSSIRNCTTKIEILWNNRCKDINKLKLQHEKIKTVKATKITSYSNCNKVESYLHLI